MNIIAEFLDANPDFFAEVDPFGHASRACAEALTARPFGGQVAEACRGLAGRFAALDLIRPPVEPPRGFTLTDLFIPGDN